MGFERQYYGLLSGLPELMLGKCPAPPWEALWQRSEPFVAARTQQLLAGLYLPLEHLPHLLGKLPAHHPYPLQSEVADLPMVQRLAMPYVNREELLALRQQPLASALASLTQLWQDWIRSFEVPLLQKYLDFSNQLNQYGLQWRASEQVALASLLRDQEMPSLSTLEAALEQAVMPGELQQLVHSNSSIDESWQTDAMKWRWLEEQVFHEPFGMNALIAYALRQQMSWHWYEAPAFDASTYLTSAVHQMLD
jgi:hypothetical protein